MASQPETTNSFAGQEVPSAAEILVALLERLQHRGQKGAGIQTQHNGLLYDYKGFGLVTDVFDGVDYAKKLLGPHAIGHVRYPTAKDNSIDAQQPFSLVHADDHLCLAHNGNLTNYAQLREELEASGAGFRTRSDTEVILHLIAQERARHAAGTPLEDLLIAASRRLHGAYSLLLLASDRLIAMRDPQGFRPLVIGCHQNRILVASETCALDLFRATDRRHVAPGEVCVITKEGTAFRSYAHVEEKRYCSFEVAYFSRPDSVQETGESCGTFRKRFGTELAEVIRARGIHADVVIAVPDSANAMALATAKALGVDFDFGIIRGHGRRSFTLQGDRERGEAVHLKLNADPDAVRGKHVLVVDDSAVRGTTGPRVARLLRDAGALSVHLALATPSVTHPCFHGIDTPTFEELFAVLHPNEEEMARSMEMDSVTYLPMTAYARALRDPEGKKYCTTCFTGVPPVSDQPLPLRSLMRRQRVA